MISNTACNYFAVGAAGAAAVELLKLYEYRGKLSEKKFHSLIRSGMFWSVVAGMLLASGFIAWAVYADTPVVKAWQLVVAGVASRSVARELAAGRVANKGLHLGAAPDTAVSARDIFL